MTRMLLIAHAATAWNAEGRYQGWTDVPLSEAGRAQASRLADRLRDVPFDALVSSDLTRALETATICFDERRGLSPSDGLPRTVASGPAGINPAARLADSIIRVDRRLREISFGEWEGKSADEIDASAWPYHDVDVVPPGGEKLVEFATRINSFFNERPNGDTAIVAHRGSLRLLICRALGVPAAKHWSFRLDIASISELDFSSGQAVLVRLNDTHHLTVPEERHG